MRPARLDLRRTVGVFAATLLGCARVAAEAPAAADAMTEAETGSDEIPACTWPYPTPPLDCPPASAGPCAGDPLPRQLEAELSGVTPVGIAHQHLFARRGTTLLAAPIGVEHAVPRLALGDWIVLPSSLRAFLPRRESVVFLDCPKGAGCVAVTRDRTGARASFPLPDGLDPRGLVSFETATGTATCAHGRGVYCFDGPPLGWLVPPERVPGLLLASADSFVAGSNGIVLRLEGGVCRVPVDTTADLVQIAAYGNDLALRTADDLLLAGSITGVHPCSGTLATDLALGRSLSFVDRRRALISHYGTTTCEERPPTFGLLDFDLVSGGVYENRVVVTGAGVFGDARFGLD